MHRTIRVLGIDYVNPAIVTFTAAARREVARLRSAFPGKFVAMGWGYSVRAHTKEGQTLEELGDRIIVGLGTPEEKSTDPALIVTLDGHDIEIAIPADVTTSDGPVIDTNASGRLTLRQ